jgi:acyl-CoA thioesterase-1
MIENLVRTVHPEKAFGYLTGMQDEATIAALYGLDADTYRSIKERFDENARRVAEELLEDPSFAERVDRLPFRPGETLVAVGDSFTDDLQSWLEIVRHLLALRRPKAKIRTVNAGVSAQTSAMALRRFVPLVSQEEPDWIVCFLGGNDATRVGPEPNKPQVGLEETVENLKAMRRMASLLADARWVWITPPTFDEERAASYPPFRTGQSYWRNEDVVAIGDYLRERPDPVVDIQAAFGLPADPGLQGPDGVHPSLAGQKAIAGAFVESLTRWADRGSP